MVKPEALTSDWSSRTLRAMRRPILEAFRARGAMTVSELDEQGVEVLHLRLNQAELIRLLESARRHQLIVPLASACKPNGSPAVDTEWALTDTGRRELSGFLSWVGGLAGSVTRHVKLLASGVSAGAWAALTGPKVVTIPFVVLPSALCCR